MSESSASPNSAQGFLSRSEAKRTSREADERDLASGAKSPAELKWENTHFARVKVRVDLSRTRALS